VLHSTVFELGLLTAMRWAPYLFLALPLGVWVDRRRRKPLLVLADLGQAALLASIPLLYVLGALNTELLLAVAFATGSFAVLFELAYRSYLPSVVERAELTDANAKLSMSQSGAEVGGPALGGVLVQAIGAPLAVLLDALSFLVSAVGLLAIKREEPHVKPGPEVRLRTEIAQGLRLTFASRLLRAFAGEAATYNLFWALIQAVMPLYLIRELRFPASALGVILGVGSVGALLGAAYTGRVASRIGVGTTMIAAAVIGDLAPLAIPAVSANTVAAAVALGGALFIQGVGITGCNVHTNSIRQTITPPRLLGRTNASYRVLVSGAAPLGGLAGGILGASLGLHATLLLGAVGLLTPAAWLVFSPVRGLHALEELEPTLAPGQAEVAAT
jgi:MFS family permease